MVYRTSLFASTAPSLLFPLAAIAWLASGSAYAATPTFYDDEGTYTTDITYSVTDDYSHPAYMFIQSDAVMSAVLGETDYHTTGFANLNIVSGGTYCAGCNGTFELQFQTTTYGTAEGVNGVGLTVLTNSAALPYLAYITYADGTTENAPLPSSGFWGVTAPERIERIHFGLMDGGTTQDGMSSFQIDNLIVGDYFDSTPCGDGIPTPDEECDEMVETATCDANCTFAVCGDSTFNPTAGELCDDGGISTPTCNPDCTVPICGDMVVNSAAGEDCDEGAETATCDADCTLSACGDDEINVTAGETCDDGGQSPNCDDDCTAVECGDGVENNLAGEYCDDGNTEDGDGCSATCETEEGPGTTTDDGGSSDSSSDGGSTDTGDTGDTGESSSDSGDGETAADSSAGDTEADTTDGESGSASMTATDSDSMTGVATDTNADDSSSSGVDANDDDAGGCGCTTANDERNTGWLALAMLGLGALKPRRRR
jgi:MYXO-CTERM domain-containing protein